MGLWCPICNIGFNHPHLSQDEADRHVIKHVAAGEWPNANTRMVLGALCRALLNMEAGEWPRDDIQMVLGAICRVSLNMEAA